MRRIGSSVSRAEAKPPVGEENRFVFVRRRGAKRWEVHAAETTFGLPVGYTRGDVEVAFRRLARKAHPDAGGSSEAFHVVVVQRELLLTDLLVREYLDTASDATC